MCRVQMASVDVVAVTQADAIVVLVDTRTISPRWYIDPFVLR